MGGSSHPDEGRAAHWARIFRADRLRKTANGKKSNKLPSSELLKRRKDSIVGYWEMLKNLEDVKFNKEAETLLILPATNWQNSLFGQMSAAIEMTALQRGVGRWPNSLQNALA